MTERLSDERVAAIAETGYAEVYCDFMWDHYSSESQCLAREVLELREAVTEARDLAREAARCIPDAYFEALPDSGIRPGLDRYWESEAWKHRQKIGETFNKWDLAAAPPALGGEG